MFDILFGITDFPSQYFWYLSCVSKCPISRICDTSGISNVLFAVLVDTLLSLISDIVSYQYPIFLFSLLHDISRNAFALRHLSISPILFACLSRHLSVSNWIPGLTLSILLSLFSFLIVISHPFMRNIIHTISSFSYPSSQVSLENGRCSGHWNHLFLCFLCWLFSLFSVSI